MPSQLSNYSPKSRHCHRRDHRNREEYQQKWRLLPNRRETVHSALPTQHSGKHGDADGEQQEGYILFSVGVD